MPRYMIERVFDDLTEQELERVTMHSIELAESQFPDIAWERSHVCTDAEGAIKSFCIYSSPTEEQLRAHAELIGSQFTSSAQLYEIVEDVSPETLSR